MVEIGNELGLFRLPTQRVPSSLTRGKVVDRYEMRKPAEVVDTDEARHNAGDKRLGTRIFTYSWLLEESFAFR